MKVLLGLVAIAVCIEQMLCQGAGRAIPVASENYAISLFLQINPRIRYDSTNYLVDLAGNYANCQYSRTRGVTVIDNVTPEGASIAAIQDYTRGDEMHVNAVNEYLRNVFDSWAQDDIYGFREQVRVAEKFGCSVRPGCQGLVSVACLFSPAGGVPGPTRPKPRPTTPRPTQRPTPRPTTPRRTNPPPTNPEPEWPQNAKAFTYQQYKEAEKMTHQKWDSSHFLENLSGFETKCNMMYESKHDFQKASGKAKDYGKQVTGMFASAQNKGSTPDALDIILEKMRLGKKAKKVGCSLIPDCIDIYSQDMYVVASCIFELYQ